LVLCALALAGSALAPAAASGQGVDHTCELSLTKFDPAVVNVAYPDQAETQYLPEMRFQARRAA